MYNAVLTLHALHNCTCSLLGVGKLYTVILSLDGTPTQQQLTQLDVPDLNMSVQINDDIRKYVTLGKYLLNNNQWVIMDRLKNDDKHIVDELLYPWINGGGQKGKENFNTWEMLVISLHNNIIIEENDLADKIESVLEFCMEQRARGYKKCILGNAEHMQEKSTERDFLLISVVTAAVFLGATVVIIHYWSKGKGSH